MTTPPDPISDLSMWSAQVAEQFNAYVRAGIPPMAVAVMLGTMLGTMGSSQQPGSDGD